MSIRNLKTDLTPRQIVVGVGGGIAAYKVANLVRLLVKAGHEVRVIPTAAALQFVGETTWAALSGKSAPSSVFADAAAIDHVEAGRLAELVVVAPATADLLARAAAGLADDLLTNTLLTATCPVIMAPAMHTQMWLHPATQENVLRLRNRGITVLEPASGELTSGDTGPGRLSEPEELAEIVAAMLASPRTKDLSGMRVVISAGGTQEPIDPVRFLGNRSTGRQGVALAQAAQQRGAEVTLVAANIGADVLPTGIRTVLAPNAAELATVMTSQLKNCDVVIMTAAVADFTPREYVAQKIKKEPGTAAPVLELVRTPDILAQLARTRQPGQTVVGFAAETGSESEVKAYGEKKARTKGADILAVNTVGADQGFGDVPQRLWLLNSAGEEIGAASGSKLECAHALLDAVVTLRSTNNR